jgi:hypothetical protein
MATYEKDYNLQDKPVRCSGCFDGPKSCDICGDGYNELTPNQLIYTLKELQVCYDTDQVVMLFQEILEEGYTGLSLGLIIDLIKQRLDAI